MPSVYKRIILAIFISVCSDASAKVAPDYIQICPGLKSDCLKENIQRTIPQFVKGVPALGLNSTDPLHINQIKLDLPGGLKIDFTDGNITGLRKCIVESAKYDNFVGELVIHCDLLIKGKYKANGKILLFTIQGDGDAKIKTRDVVVTTQITFNDKVRNGVVYHEVKNIKTSYRFDERVSFGLTNLFKGSPELSQTILTFMNENWKQVLEEFGKPIVNEILQLSLEAVKQFFKVIPKNELIA